MSKFTKKILDKFRVAYYIKSASKGLHINNLADVSDLRDTARRGGGENRKCPSQSGLQMFRSVTYIVRGKPWGAQDSFSVNSSKRGLSGLKKGMTVTERMTPPIQKSLESELTQSPALLIGFLFGGGLIGNLFD